MDNIMKKNEYYSENSLTNSSLPGEIIFDILSHVPLKHLHRFKFVNRRLWNALLLHPNFRLLRPRNSSQDYGEFEVTYHQEDYSFAVRSWSRQDLHLMQSSTRATYRIYSNILKSPVHSPSLCIALDFVLSIQDVKLISVHEDHHSQLAYEILHVGFVGNTYCWRAVDADLQSGDQCRNWKRKKIQVFFGRASVAYCISQDDDDDVDIEVDILDMENDSYIGHTTFPKGFLSTTTLLDWNGRLSFAEIVKDELHVLVLEDHRNLKWAETKRIIRLMPSFLQRVSITDRVVCAHKSNLFFVRKDKVYKTSHLCEYDIHTGKLKTSPLDFGEDGVAIRITTRLALSSMNR